MIKREPAAVFLDIDGTLLSGTVPKENTEEIRRVQKEGHKVLLNTGRAFGFIPFEKLEGIRFDGICAGAGAYVSIGDRVLFRKNADSDYMGKLVRFFFETGRSVFFEGEACCFALNPEPSFDPGKFGGRRVVHLSSTEEWEKTYRNEPITKVALWRTEVTDEELAVLSEEFHIIRHKTYTETVLHGCDKARGMKVALAAFSIPRERSIAMGDSENDLEMLTYAGMPVAMGNATDSVKAACRLVTAPASEAGVAQALRMLL